MNLLKPLSALCAWLAFLFAVYSMIGYMIIATLLAGAFMVAGWATAPPMRRSDADNHHRSDETR